MPPLLLLLSLILSVPAIETEAKEKVLPSPSPVPEVNVVKAAIERGRRKVYIRKFAQLPLWEDKPSKIVGMTSFGRNLYATTSSTGARVYRVSSSGRATLWFDAARAVLEHTGRNISVSSGIHGGVRGIAFPPSFRRTGLFYITAMEDRPENEENFRYLSRPADGEPRASADSVVLEFRYDSKKRLVDPASYRQVMRIGMPFLDHPIKQLIFVGPYLFIGHGDGSLQSGDAGGGRKNDALGKVLRIIPKQSGFRPYSIPFSNPFRRDARYPDEVYAVGFRNPHNLCHSARSGLFVADVGRDNVEEINLVKSGHDYGWPNREGTFRHLKVGGTGIGVTRLPLRDRMFNYTYPSAQVGHKAAVGARYTGQGVAGGCPVENGSKNNGLYFYANFPLGGELYYSYVRRLQAAVTMGSPDELSPATTFRTTIMFDHDNDDKTPALKMPDLRAILRLDTERPLLNRADVRFGRGQQGEIYVSSKANGGIYVITSTIPSRA